MMNRDDIIRMAREAATDDGSVNRNDGKNVVIYAAKTNLFLERFAALVAAAERARLAQPEPKPEKSHDRTYVEDDGCPTEKAVLQRFWREHQAQPEPVAIIEQLWGIIDDIDTYSDVAKTDDKLYRSLVERKQKDRWKTGITTDGYTLNVPLCTAPPQREWVGLTEDDLNFWGGELGLGELGKGVLRAVEDHLKKENK